LVPEKTGKVEPSAPPQDKGAVIDPIQPFSEEFIYVDSPDEISIHPPLNEVVILPLEPGDKLQPPPLDVLQFPDISIEVKDEDAAFDSDLDRNIRICTQWCSHFDISCVDWLMPKRTVLKVLGINLMLFVISVVSLWFYVPYMLNLIPLIVSFLIFMVTIVVPYGVKTRVRFIKYDEMFDSELDLRPESNNMKEMKLRMKLAIFGVTESYESLFFKYRIKHREYTCCVETLVQLITPAYVSADDKISYDHIDGANRRLCSVQQNRYTLYSLEEIVSSNNALVAKAITHVIHTDHRDWGFLRRPATLKK